MNKHPEHSTHNLHFLRMVLLCICCCFFCVFPAFPDVFDEKSENKSVYIKKQVGLKAKQKIHPPSYKAKLYVTPITHKTTKSIKKLPLEVEKGCLTSNSLWHSLRSTNGLTIYRTPTKMELKETNASFGLSLPEGGISLKDWNILDVVFHDLNPYNPVQLGIILNVDTNGDDEADLQAKALASITPRGSGECVNAEKVDIQTNTAVSSPSHLVLQETIDMSKVNYRKKDYFYYLLRVFGLSFDEDWRYIQDGTHTVLQRRFNRRILPGQLLHIYLQPGIKFLGVNLAVGFKGNLKPEDILHSEHLSIRNFHENGFDVLAVDLGELLVEKYAQKEFLYLDEIFLHIEGQAESIIPQNVVKKILFYQNALLKGVPNTLQVPVLTGKKANGLYQLRINLGALRQKQVIGGKITDLNLQLFTQRNIMGGLLLSEVSFQQQCYESEHGSPVLLDLGNKYLYDSVDQAGLLSDEDNKILWPKIHYQSNLTDFTEPHVHTQQQFDNNNYLTEMTNSKRKLIDDPVKLILPFDTLAMAEFTPKDGTEIVLELQGSKGNRQIPLTSGKAIPLAFFYKDNEPITIDKVTLWIQQGIDLVNLDSRSKKVDVVLNRLMFFSLEELTPLDVLKAELPAERVKISVKPALFGDSIPGGLVEYEDKYFNFMRIDLSKPWVDNIICPILVGIPMSDVTAFAFHYELPDWFLISAPHALSIRFNLTGKIEPIIIRPLLNNTKGSLRLQLDQKQMANWDKETISSIDIQFDCKDFPLDMTGTFYLSEFDVGTNIMKQPVTALLNSCNIIRINNKMFKLGDAEAITDNDWSSFLGGGMWVTLPNVSSVKWPFTISFPENPYFKVSTVFFENNSSNSDPIPLSFAFDRDDSSSAFSYSTGIRLLLCLIIPVGIWLVFKYRSNLLRWLNYVLQVSKQFSPTKIFINGSVGLLIYGAQVLKRFSLHPYDFILKPAVYRLWICRYGLNKILGMILIGPGVSLIAIVWNNSNLSAIVVTSWLLLVLAVVYQWGRRRLAEVDIRGFWFDFFYGTADGRMPVFLKILGWVLIFYVLSLLMGKRVSIWYFMLFLGPLYIFTPCVVHYIRSLHCRPIKAVLTFTTAFILSALCYYKGRGHVAMGGNYYSTFGALLLVLVYYGLVIMFRPFISRTLSIFLNMVCGNCKNERKRMGIETEIEKPEAGYDSNGHIFIVGFLLTLFIASVFLALRLEQIAEQSVVVGYHMLIVGVICKVWTQLACKKHGNVLLYNENK